MSRESLRRGLAAAVGGAVLVAALLVGVAFAFAQDADEPDDPFDGIADRIEEFLSEVQSGDVDEAVVESLDEIAAELATELEPLIEEIRERTLAAIDSAVSSGALPEERAEALEDKIKAFELPDGFPFEFGKRFGILPDHLPFEGHCFRLWMSPEGAEFDEECPDLEFPEGFPFPNRGFRFGPAPEGFGYGPFEFGPGFPFHGEDLDEFLEELELDLDELREKLESGMNLREALEDLDIDLEGLLDEGLAEAMAKLDELVAEGELSQERADAVKEMLEGFGFGNRVPWFDFFEFGDLAPEDFEFHHRGFPFRFPGSRSDGAERDA